MSNMKVHLRTFLLYFRAPRGEHVVGREGTVMDP